MKKIFICLLVGVLLILPSVCFANSVGTIYAVTPIDNDYSLAAYFKAWSEEDSELMYPGTLNEYWMYKKRSCASSEGYIGKLQSPHII